MKPLPPPPCVRTAETALTSFEDQPRIVSEHGKTCEKLGISHLVESNAKCFFLSPMLAVLRGAAITFGLTIDPHQSWLVLRGIRTLGMRVERAQENAIAIARDVSVSSRQEQKAELPTFRFLLSALFL